MQSIVKPWPLVSPAASHSDTCMDGCSARQDVFDDGDIEEAARRGVMGSWDTQRGACCVTARKRRPGASSGADCPRDGLRDGHSCAAQSVGEASRIQSAGEGERAPRPAVVDE
jgi:hypothetical protein